MPGETIERAAPGASPHEDLMDRLARCGHHVSLSPMMSERGLEFECSCGWESLAHPEAWWVDAINDHSDAVERDLLASAKASAEPLDDAERAFLDANYPDTP